MTALAPARFPFAVRAYRPTDEGFVVGPWLEELRHAPSSRFVRNLEFFRDQRQLVLDILRSSVTLVACAPDAPDHNYGFVCHGPGPLAHWLYVKSSFRSLGIGRGLLESAFPEPPATLYATHAGRAWERLVASGMIPAWRMVYRPHLLMRPLSEER